MFGVVHESACGTLPFAGIEFIDENGGAGVRLKSRAPVSQNKPDRARLTHPSDFGPAGLATKKVHCLRAGRRAT